MKTIALGILCVLLTVSAAGCLSADADPAGTAASTTTSAAAPTTSSAPTQAPNSPPEIVVKVLSNGTELSLSNGSYALKAGDNVTFDASGSSDPEGLGLSFRWDFGDGNTSEESAPVHAFDAGNHTVNLTVEDEEGASDAESLLVVVKAGIVEVVEAKKFTGTILLGTQGTDACGVAGDGVDTETTDWDLSAAIGITKFTMKIDQGDTGVDMDYYLLGPDGKQVAKSAHFEPTDGPEKGFSVEGQFAPGKYQLRVIACTAADASYTVEMTANLLVAG